VTAKDEMMEMATNSIKALFTISVHARRYPPLGCTDGFAISLGSLALCEAQIQQESMSSLSWSRRLYGTEHAV
jgi:hypothetical protein